MKYLLYQFLLILLLLLPFSGHGQALKFKELYPLIEAGDYDDAEARLLEYLAEEPDDPAANLQLALIYDRRYKTSHPIYQFEVAMNSAQKAKDMFLKASLLVDEREIRRNGKRYYTNLAQVNDRGNVEVEYSRVRSKIDSAYIEIDDFMRNVPAIHLNFTRGVKFYDKALKRYGDLAARYTSQTELYLLLNASLRQELNNLKTDYDSSVYYLNNYLVASGNFPVTSKKQKLSVRKINDFRIDGYSFPDDFLAEEIFLWNFSTWCDTIISVHQDEIIPLLERVGQNDHKLKVNLDFLSTLSADLPADFHMHQIDNDLFKVIRKFDHNSLLVPLLSYRKHKQELLMKMRHYDKGVEGAGNDLTAESRLAFISTIYGMMGHNRELLQQTMGLANDSNLNLYENFIEDNYNGISGFNEYLSEEKQFLDSQFDSYADKIRRILIQDMVYYPDTVQPVVYEGKNVPLYKIFPDSLNFPDETYYTLHIVPSPDTTFYLGGVTRSGKENIHLSGYMAKTDKEQGLSWLKTMELIPEETDSTLLAALINGPVDSAHFDNIVTVMEPAPQGCAIILSTKEKNSGNMLNSLKIINAEGEEIMSDTFEISGVARGIKYNEYEDAFMVVFKGDSLLGMDNGPDRLTLLKIDRDGTLIWEKEYTFEGKFIDLIRIDNGYLIFGTPYTGINNEEGHSSGEQNNGGVFTLRVDQEGNKQELKSFSINDPFHLIQVNKIDESLISLLGIKDIPGNIQEMPIPDEKDVKQILINASLERY